MKHAELVERAARWLRNTKKCRVVLTEIVTLSSEQPDVIGWHGGMSLLVECKTSRADFRRDREKYARRDSNGLGNKRWYCAPAGVLRSEDVPDGWGLVEVLAGRRMWIVKDAPWHKLEERAHRDEKYLLMSACWRTASGVGMKPVFEPRRAALPGEPDRVDSGEENDPMAMTVEELKKEPNLAAAYQEMIREAAEQAEASWNAKSPEERERIRAENDAAMTAHQEEYQAKLAMEGTPCLCHLVQPPAMAECLKCPDNPKHDPPRPRDPVDGPLTRFMAGQGKRVGS